MKTTISFGRYVKTAMNLKEMYPVQRWSLGIRKVKDSSLLICRTFCSILVELDGFNIIKVANRYCLIFIISGPGHTSSGRKTQVYGHLFDSSSHSPSTQSAQTQENKHSYFYIQARDLPPIGNNTSILCKM